MKSKLIVLSLAAVLSVSYSNYVLAHEGMQHDEGMESMDHEKGAMMENQDVSETKAVEVGNTICPVSGDKIPASGEEGEMGEAVKYEYNGKIYNLCCKMCVKDFKANPEKYSKIAEEEAAKSKMAEVENGTEEHSDHDHE